MRAVLNHPLRGPRNIVHLELANYFPTKSVVWDQRTSKATDLEMLAAGLRDLQHQHKTISQWLR